MQISMVIVMLCRGGAQLMTGGYSYVFRGERTSTPGQLTLWTPAPGQQLLQDSSSSHLE